MSFVDPWRLILISVLLVTVGFRSTTTAQENLPESELKPVAQFIDKYCISCHGAESQAGDRRFDRLMSNQLHPDQIEDWHEILDRLNLADMPPDDAPLTPNDDERLAMATKLTNVLAASSNTNREPQTILRRLNRTEYDAAMRNVLGLESMLADPTADFTPDEPNQHFTNVGDSLVLSDLLLTRYLEASGHYLSQARELTEPITPSRTWKFTAPFCRNMPNPDGQDREGHYQHIRENATDEFGYLWLKKLGHGVPSSGNYRIKVKASAIGRKHPYKDWILDVATDDPLQISFVAGDTRAGDLATVNPTDRLLAVMDVADNRPQWYETTVWLDRHYQPRLGFPNGPVRIKYQRHSLMKEHRDLFPGFIRDRIHIFHDMHPDYDPKTAPALEAVFLDEQERLKNAGKPYDVFGSDHSIHTDAAWKQFYSEYQGPRIRVFEILIEGPIDSPVPAMAKFFPSTPIGNLEAINLIDSFANLAFRRPVKTESLQSFNTLYQNEMIRGSDHRDALQLAYQAVLCSPEFLYHRTSRQKFDAHDLANRLSFFLWSTPPDDELRKLAEGGQIFNPDVLAAQTERMLKDKRNQTMVAEFTDAWLHLDKLGTMLPDREEHPAYYNERLEDAMRKETRMYVADAIQNDAKIVQLIDSKYTFVNSSLARLYKIGNVQGHELRKVSLSDRRRGGLLGQASVLTASANGIDTSPVLRGVWVLECLLGTPPSPPPPDVEPIEPDTRGATTIREQLAKHRNVATCNHCHRRIDPFGFALESFDEIGQFRSHYEFGGWRKNRGPDIETSAVLPSGEPFADIVELKSRLKTRIDLVTTNVANKLLIHATGRIDDPQDRSDVLALIQSLQADSEKKTTENVGMRQLIHGVIQSPAFRR